MPKEPREEPKGPMDVTDDDDENLGRSVRVLRKYCGKELDALERAIIARQPVAEIEGALDSLHEAYRQELSLEFFRMAWQDPAEFVRVLFH